MGTRRSMSLAVWMWLLLPVVLVAWPVAVSGGEDPITIYITDFGINQWKPALRLGDDFHAASNRVFDNIPSAGQILVPMPSMDELRTAPPAVLEQRITQAVSERVKGALKHGQWTFEVQLVQNVSTPGYADTDRQKAVNTFGGIAYRALGRTLDALEADGHRTSAYAMTASNGTKMLVENLAALYRHGTIYLEGADFFDGRAFFMPMVPFIKAIGAERVRLFNTHWDWPAPYTPVGARSIGNFDTAMDLKELFPQLQVYLLSFLASPQGLGAGHIIGMAKPGERFAIDEYRGEGRLVRLAAHLTGRELRRVHDDDGGWSSRLDRERLDGSTHTIRPTWEWMAVRRDKAEHLATAILAYAKVLRDATPDVLKQLPLLRKTGLNPGEEILLKTGQVVKHAYALSEALQRDLQANRRGSWAFLRAETLEELDRFGLSTLKALKLEKNEQLAPLVRGMVKRVDAVQELVTAMGKQARDGGTLSVANHYVDAIQAFAEVAFENRKTPLTVLSFLDRIQEGATAYQHRNKGLINTELATEVVTIVNNLAWTALGLTVCRGESKCASAFQGLGATAATVGRDATAGSFERLEMLTQRRGISIVDQWLAMQQDNIAAGREVVKISKAYGVDLLKRVGLSDAQILQLDEAAEQRRANLRRASLTPGSPAVSGKRREAEGSSSQPAATPGCAWPPCGSQPALAKGSGSAGRLEVDFDGIGRGGVVSRNRIDGADFTPSR